MAAVGAKGRTILRGAAKEPEIIELCNYLDPSSKTEDLSLFVREYGNGS